MKITHLAKAFSEGKIEKKFFWQLMREKFALLLDYKELIADNSVCDAIIIDKEGAILVFGSNGKGGGIKIRFDFSETISRAEAILSMKGDYEQEDFDFLVANIKSGDVIFDVGGNVGLFSLILAYACPNTTIYSFEPIPVTYEKLEKNLDLNKSLKKNIQTFNIGFSSEQGTFDFFLPGTNQAASMKPINDEFYLMESDSKGNYTGKEKLVKIECKVDTIDLFCNNHSISKIDILKLDIEGAERDALTGAKGTLNKFLPLVYCEMLRKHAARFGYHPNEIIDYMNEKGYDCFAFHHHKFITFQKMDESTLETNFFFLHRDKHSGIINKYLEV